MSHLMTRLVGWSQRFSLRAKIMGLAVGAVLLMGTSASILAQTGFMASTTAELERRGQSIAADAAARGADMLLTHNVLGLYDLLQETIANNEDVRYVIMLDARGRVAVHTFGAQFPGDMLTLDLPGKGQRGLVQLLNTEEGLIHDVSVPILDGTAGTVRVGMSPQRLRRAAMNQAQWLALMVVGVAALAIAGAYSLTTILTRPVMSLVQIARAAAGGDLTRRAPPAPPDEIGVLTASFNDMLGQLQESQRVRNDLLDRIIAAQEDERRRIARELHDETSQAITSMIVGLRTLEEGCPEVTERSAELRQLAATTLDEIHSLILELRPRALDELGLVPALRRYMTDFAQKHNLPVDFQLVGHETRLPYRLETCIYRVVQEALTNVARHSHAHAASVVLDLRPGQASVIIEDDGVGFDPEEVGMRSLGIVGMRERAALLDGTLQIESRPGSGTTLFVKLPVAEG